MRFWIRPLPDHEPQGPDWAGLEARARALHLDVTALPLPPDAKGVYLAQKLTGAAFQLLEALLRYAEWAGAKETGRDEVAEPDPAALIARARRAVGEDPDA